MTRKLLFTVVFALTIFHLSAQEVEEVKKKSKPVRSMFESSWLINNQSVIVPTKGTFQMDIIHRFGVLKNGYDDFYGLFAPSNIKIGFGYSIMDNLSLGLGITKFNKIVDLSWKYAIIQQTRSGSIPLSLTYFGNVGIDTRAKDNFENGSDRYSYFHQLIMARKFSDKLSIQLAPSLSHFNAVEAYLNQEEEIEGLMNNDHLAISVGGRFKVKENMALIANYDQPITSHISNNPNPNLSFGVEIATSAHAFQIFVSNSQNIIPQRNNVFNSNNFEDGEFLIGFNITRLWSW